MTELTHGCTVAASAGEPRIPPGTAADIGYLNQWIAWILGAAAGTAPPNLVTTLARHRLLLRAVDELHSARVISDELWTELSARLSEPDLIELCMLIGHYEMLAMTLLSLGVQPDPPPSGPPARLVRLLQRAARRVRHARSR